MLLNYLKIAIRNLRTHTVYSFINLFGLAVGVASCLLIVLFVNDERAYDQFLPNASRIYQLNTAGNFGGSDFTASGTPPPLGKTVMQEHPEVEAYTRLFKVMDAVVQREHNGKVNRSFTEAQIMAADSNFLQVLGFSTLLGDPATCLKEPNSVVVTEKIARKYFGKPNVVGQVLKINSDPFKITGVLADLPSQSSIQFDFLTPMKNYGVVQYFDWSWVWLNVATYIRLNERVASDPDRIQALEARFPAMVKKYAEPAFQRIGQPDFLKNGGRWAFLIQPITDIHLGSGGMSTHYQNLGDRQQVDTFTVVAVFIVVLACVNFMNLATARSVKRAREVGVRKVLGSHRSTLIAQFLTESLLYSFMASLLGLGLVTVLLPFFNQLAGKTFSADVLTSAEVLAVTGVLALLVGLLAGSYPAFYLTSFNPVQTLKNGILKTSLGQQLTRNGLVVFQFVVSTVLIVGTIVVFAQLRFAQNKDLGLNKENVLVVRNANRLGQNEDAFRQELTRLAEVSNASISTSVPLQGGFGDFYNPVQTAEKQIAKDLLMYSFMTDYDLVPTLNIRLIQGRNFSPEFSDSLSVILNETAVKQIGWKNPIGQSLVYPGGVRQAYKVIGVMKDFDMESVRSAMVPFALFHESSKSFEELNSYVVARIRPGKVDAAVKKIEAIWKRFKPDTPFDYTFLDNEFANAYRTEQQTGRVFGAFTALAIFIACLGLFGLTTFAAEQRTKEIGVRKVLGASVASIVGLLSKDFLKLVILSIVIASPIAWYIMNQWLADFKYKIDLEWWMFVLAGGLALVIAFATVSFQSIKAALTNPTKSLKSE
ncbi:ABC transporter permease [Larkinella insperata]|uniref:ABC transporter permease n=1 Tax=Larkinella insperata TaxID=332158 RepID=A0ABW3QGS2_9BACT|nr:ABC transporter permease [Larkinella insperata]